MTTCITGLLQSDTSDLICFCHFDRIDLAVDFRCFVEICNIISNQEKTELDLYLIGGYQDERDVSEKLALDLLVLFDKIDLRINLKMALIGKINTIFGLESNELSGIQSDSTSFNTPVLTGVGFNLKERKISSITLLRDINIDIGPLYDLRRIFLSFHCPTMSQYISIYDHRKQLVSIPIFKFNQCFFTKKAINYFQKALKLTDQEILNVGHEFSNNFLIV